MLAAKTAEWERFSQAVDRVLQGGDVLAFA